MSVSGGTDLVTNGMVLSLDICNRYTYIVGSSDLYNSITKKYIGNIGSGTYSKKYNGSLTYSSGNGFSGDSFPNLGITNTFTINLFIELISATGSYQSWLIGSEIYNTNGFRCGFINNKLAFWSNESGGNFYFESPSNTFLVDLNPFYVTISFNSSTGTARIYKNGILLASQAGATLIAPTANSFVFNTTLNGTSTSLILGHLSMHNTELSQLQILQNYKNLKSRFRLT
jgi:hypothetical protein